MNVYKTQKESAVNPEVIEAVKKIKINFDEVLVFNYDGKPLGIYPAWMAYRSLKEKRCHAICNQPFSICLTGIIF
jgi:hypothetical protein